MLLTKSTSFIIGPVASLLGYIMNGIFWLLENIGIPNIGLSIILFTIVIYMLLMPMTIKQQKFSKLQAIMQPEINKIQKKYKGKNNDQAAMMKMNEETQAVYEKYGVSPMGSCLQLIIQMPILFALYRVIWNIPAYVTSVKNAFMPLAQELMNLSGVEEFMAEIAKTNSVTFKEMTELTLIDVLYKFKPANCTSLAEQFPDIADVIASTQSNVDNMNYFLGLNIADAPLQIITSAIASGAILLAIGAALIPILSGLSQWLSAKLMSTNNDRQTNSGNAQADQMAASMKTMNTVMPLMSAVFCLTLPVGMGIYWIAGAVIRTIQQVVINKKLDKMDMEEFVRKNLEKASAKRAKKGLPPQQQAQEAKRIVNAARMNTKNIDTPQMSQEEKDQRMKESTEYYKSNTTAKPGSLASKAQMVQQYNERNKKK